MAPNKASLPAASVGRSHPPARLTVLKEDAVGGLGCLHRSDVEDGKASLPILERSVRPWRRESRELLMGNMVACSVGHGVGGEARLKRPKSSYMCDLGWGITGEACAVGPRIVSKDRLEPPTSSVHPCRKEPRTIAASIVLSLLSTDASRSPAFVPWTVSHANDDCLSRCC